ncbi:MAG TPA: DsrE/DsrF/DrsH-like family protein [Chloroflexota bacterium]|nr:DsrE/DsrF/DrsH-like family protein [Chloroflexota bacterium]
MADKMSIVVFSGTVDKLFAVSTLATGASAMGMEVDIFLTFWGLHAFRRDQVRTNTKFSSEFAEFAAPAMEAMQAKGVRHWLDTLNDAKEIGTVHVLACSMTMELFGWSLDDLDPIVEDITGVATFVEEARTGEITLFI